MSPRKSTKAALVCRGTVCPSTSPDWVFERGEERQRAVPVIFEAMPLGPPRRKRQHGIEAIERLNGGFLVDGKDRGVVRRIDVEANHVGGLPLEVGIVRLHVAFEPVRLKAGALPGFRHEVVMDLEYAPQFAGTPVRAAVRRRRLCLCQDPRFHGRRQDRRWLTAIPRPQALQPIGQEAAAPPIDVVAIARDRRFNGRVRVAIRQHQNHPRAARVLCADLETTYAAFELGCVHRSSTSAPYGATQYRYLLQSVQATSVVSQKKSCILVVAQVRCAACRENATTSRSCLTCPL